MIGQKFCVTSLLMVSVSTAALAQANENAVTDADDAFGFTSGDETVGIYSEQSVRGFDLEAAGNYRVNGRYFVKSSGVSSFFIDTTTVQIGYNTFGVDQPGPSGVVNYKLRDPAPGTPSLITVGMDPHTSPYIDALFKYASKDGRLSGTAGLGIVTDSRNDQGGEQSSWLLGGTVKMKYGKGSSLQFFGGEYDYKRHGTFIVRTDGSFLPKEIERGKFIGQNWAREQGQRRIAGALLEQKFGRDWQLDATAVFSQEDPTSAYTQVLTLAPDSDSANSIVIASPHQKATAWSSEIKLSRTLSRDRMKHRFAANLRGRLSRKQLGGEELISLNNVQFGQRGETTTAPTLAGRADLRDEVDQWGMGLSYQLAWADTFQLNAGLLRSDYLKRFSTPTTDSRTQSKPWLYNIGMAYKPTAGIELYGSYSRGLEEAGTAPANADNRNAVLPAIIVTQKELGIKAALAPKLMLIVAGFDTRKPYAALDAGSNIYGLTGRVRHYGIEASLSGEIGNGLTAVVGGVFTKARLSSQGVNDGLIGDRPVGVPTTRGILNINYELPTASGLSLDAGLEYIGRRTASSRITDNRQLRTPSSLVSNAGLRYSFGLAGQKATLRAQMLNLFNDFDWSVSNSETFSYSAPRRFRLVLTTEF